MINIIKHRKIPFIISGLLFVSSVVLLLVLGLKPGIDFTGGSLIEVTFTGERPNIIQVEEALTPLDFGSLLLQPSDDDAMIIKLRFVSEDEHQMVLSALRDNFETEEDKVLEDRVDTIGPAISSHLRERAMYAAIAVVLAIVFYVAYAFRKVSRPVKSWKYGLSAIVALIHDVTITMGVFAILGKVLGVEVDIAFVVALLTIMGYSVNDTIVVFDRVRENLIKDGSENFARTVNRGVNETFVRSINTSLTTLTVLIALFLFGGDSIRYFSLALIIGIAFGTYSSIFLASPILVVWEEWGKRKA
ncbi:protein translocase subunit SecF [Patescibacteria group bacterium]|nr:protein translocase subunit SecF [Patescibacteria group bacterium]MBU1895386.1 protein translocase subunit SecF [Patescibacteria group bacterium]